MEQNRNMEQGGTAAAVPAEKKNENRKREVSGFSSDKPSSDIRFDIRTAIAREHCAQSLLSCPDLTVCDSVSKPTRGILSVTVFIETITLLNSVAKVAQIFEIAQLLGCYSVERNEIPYLNQRFREVETCRLPIHNGNELPCC